MFQCGGTGPFLNLLDESQETRNTFPWLFPGCFPGALFFSFSLFKIPTSIAREVCFFLNLLLLCRVFPGCLLSVYRVFPGTIFFSLLCKKSPQLLPKKFFSKLALVFPGCFLGIPEHFFCTLLLLLKIPTTFAKEVFILKHASFILNVSKCIVLRCFLGVSRVFPGCFPGDSWQIEFPLISSILCIDILLPF